MEGALVVVWVVCGFLVVATVAIAVAIPAGALAHAVWAALLVGWGLF